MNDADKQILGKVADTIRGLSMDAIQKANSGHPGLPMGCAEIAAVLFGKEMNHNPADPDWHGRDRFVLSAGHGSMLLYSALHLSGYDLGLEDLKNFRQLHSKTPGHPEYGEAPGVETTTGPLGQGVGMGAGIALGLKISAAQMGVEKEELLDGQVFVLAGDGCMMEGVSNETASLAGHLQLDNLTIIYDSNDICLDGPTSECFTEDTKTRFKGLGWHIVEIDGHDLDQIQRAVRGARRRTGKPTLIVAKTTIAKGAPTKAGTSGAHGAPLGEEEIRGAKEALGLPQEPFYVPDEVKEYFKKRLTSSKRKTNAWKKRFEAWKAQNPAKAAQYEDRAAQRLPQDFEEQIRALEIGDEAGRKASAAVLQKLHDLVPYLIGGSADLSCSDNTMMKASGIVQASDYSQRNVKFGVREFAMATMTSGMALQRLIFPYCGTFLVFSDYMRNALRLAALMQLRLVYQFTHDSIFVGEDGPTHEPVEHVAALRAIPGLTVLRPADANEVKAGWVYALSQAKGPVAFALTRQGLPLLEGTNRPMSEGVGRGAYVVKPETRSDAIDVCMIATGSEVSLAVKVAERLESQGKSVRVVSMPSQEIFNAQTKDYQDSVVPREAGKFVSLEAGVSQGWHKYVGRDGITVAVDTFGLSAPGKQVAAEFGFTVDGVLERIGA